MPTEHQECGSVVGERNNLPRAECPFWVISRHSGDHPEMSAYPSRADMRRAHDDLGDVRKGRLVTPAGFEPAPSRLGTLLPSLNVLIFYPANVAFVLRSWRITECDVAKRDVRYVPKADLDKGQSDDTDSS